MTSQNDPPIRDEIARYLGRSGLPINDNVLDRVERIVRIAVKVEREACAQICDLYATYSSNPMNFAENCAETIRRRRK